MKRLYFFIAILLITCILSAQTQACKTALEEGIKLYNAGKYKNAKEEFETGKKICKTSDFQQWINKCDEHINRSVPFILPETNKLPANITSHSGKSQQQVKCDKLLSEAQNNFLSQYNDAAFKKTLALLNDGLKDGCDTSEYRYWINIYNTNIEYFNTKLEMSPLTLEFNFQGGTNSIAVNSSYSTWDTEQISLELLKWLSIKKNQHSLMVSCSENKSLKERIGYIIVKSGSKSSQINITQNGKPYLLPEVRKLIYANLNSNCSFHTHLNLKYKGEKNINERRNGYGVQLWPNGNVFFGQFLNGECVNGIYLDADIDIPDKRYLNKYQIGDFYNLKLNGEGRCYDEDGVLSYKGNFYDDSPKDAYWTEDKYPELKFEFIEYQIGYYMGETKNGEKSGKGVFISKQGDLWYGDWVNDKKLYGIDIKMDGTIKVGSNFAEEKPVIVQEEKIIIVNDSEIKNKKEAKQKNKISQQKD